MTERIALAETTQLMAIIDEAPPEGQIFPDWVTELPSDVARPKSGKTSNKRIDIEGASLQTLVEQCRTRRIRRVTIRRRQYGPNQKALMGFTLSRESELHFQDEQAAERIMLELLGASCRAKFCVLGRDGLTDAVLCVGPKLDIVQEEA